MRFEKVDLYNQLGKARLVAKAISKMKHDQPQPEEPVLAQVESRWYLSSFHYANLSLTSYLNFVLMVSLES